MESHEFVTSIALERYDPTELEKRELDSDYRSYFTEDAQRAYEKKLSGMTLTAEEEALVRMHIESWWFEKYGFSYHQEKSRRELLARKYATKEKNARAKGLQLQLIHALKNSDNESYQRIYQEYIDEYPDQLEGVTALLEFPDHLERQEYMDTHSFQSADPGEREKMLKTVEESTQYAFLLTHFLSQNAEDKEFLANFWEVFDAMGESMGRLKESHRLRRGILSQVAVYHMFNQLGMHPKLSHPKEDAFKSVDLWVEDVGAVQVKGTDKKKDEMFVETDRAGFPAVETDSPGERKVFNAYLFDQMNRFKRKLAHYEREVGKPLRGYFAVVPYHEFDHVTGMPTGEIVRRCAEGLGVQVPEAVAERAEREVRAQHVHREIQASAEVSRVQPERSDAAPRQISKSQIAEWVLSDFIRDMEQAGSHIANVARKKRTVVLPAEEQRALDVAQHEWWKRKYGFPITDSEQRNALVALKLAEAQPAQQVTMPTESASLAKQTAEVRPPQTPTGQQRPMFTLGDWIPQKPKSERRKKGKASGG